MAATKSGSLLQPSVSVSAGATLTISNTVNATTYYGTLIEATLVPAGTLSVPATLTVNTSFDNSTWMVYQQVQSGTISGTTYAFAITVDAPAMYIQCVVLGGTGAAVTTVVQAQNLIGV